MSQPECIFCKIIAGTILVKPVFENEKIIAFNDHAPSAPVHVLIVPKKHFVSIEELGPDDLEIMTELTAGIQEVTRALGVAKGGYRTIINTGKNGGQTVFHLHIHVLAGKALNEKILG